MAGQFGKSQFFLPERLDKSLVHNGAQAPARETTPIQQTVQIATCHQGSFERKIQRQSQQGTHKAGRQQGLEQERSPARSQNGAAKETTGAYASKSYI